MGVALDHTQLHKTSLAQSPPLAWPHCPREGVQSPRSRGAGGEDGPCPPCPLSQSCPLPRLLEALLPPPPAQLQALLPSCLQPPMAPCPSGNKTRSPASSSAQPCPPPPSPPTCSLVQPQTCPFPPPSLPPAPTTLAHGLGSPHYLVSFSVSLPLRRDRPFPLCHLSASRPAPAELLDGHRVRGWTSAVFP